MPHKDRETRLAYLRAWKLRHRPAPIPEPQSDPSLPARGIIEFSADGAKVRCHVCGRWYGSLNAHLRMHGLDARAYKELFDLPRTASMWPPLVQMRQRQRALERDQGGIGRKHLPPPHGRPAGQQPRLGVRLAASRGRTGIYTRGGNKTRSRDD